LQTLKPKPNEDGFKLANQLLWRWSGVTIPK
jgi:hypothetical protein